MRRKRGRRVNWFPPIGTESTSDAGTSWYSYTFTNQLPAPFDTTVGPSLGVGTIYSPVVPDFTQVPGDVEGGTLIVSLRDRVNGQDWILKRICGSIFVTFDDSAATGDPSVCWNGLIVTVGYMVAPSEDSDQAAIAFINPRQYSAQALENTQNPWIWRRTWLLRNPLADNLGGNLPLDVPSTNIGYGDVRSGPFIDSKVARRISREHRLWQVVDVSGYDPRRNQVNGDGSKINVITDVRILGSLASSRPGSSF